MTPTLPTVVFLAVKLLALVGLGVYALFAGIMVRQEQLMGAVLEEAFEPVLRVVTIVHFVVSVGVLLLAIVLL
ncbi:hypothetical protein A3A64_04760 [Candidatus Gottesmanbacteria bacterium RIFCSPLOWO2_01_FULL_48_11]|uniref:Uncharacterized protein n=2 Tax=Candidatus Gottesmaniibacteriota TaxID=1752720 RepID=A0A0G1UPI1_9BACT|nr:MAG: hypothetical protein UY27_C0004G0042 [Candidatus Gottesmanbacteria bacterium GW2011_GWA1_48_13]OGG27815.1 MAG: hypothetical protein A3A64_04760 [Candidatus Gottesmanbacteria bacterium RIFCSPLOWO2_01_FULL_48_11]